MGNMRCQVENGQLDSGWRLTGRVVSGVGQGAGFCQLDWAKRQFMSSCGIDPFPGTLNIVLDAPRDRAVWSELKTSAGHRINANDSESCDATIYPVRIGDWVPGAIVLPEVSGYAANQIELIAALPLRQHFSLSDGDEICIAGQGPRQVNAVIFDVDGTLLNSLEGYRIAASRATEPFGYDVSYETVRRALNLNQPFWDLIIPEGKPRDETTIARLRDETMRHWPAVMAEFVDILPGLEGTLATLRDAGVRFGIYTGSAGESLPPLRDAGLLEYFEVIVTRSDVQNHKPHPEGLLKCIDEMDLDPGYTAYIGDSPHDVQASLAAGVMSVGVLTGAGDSASLAAAGAHRVLEDIAGLPGLFDLGIRGG
jgi:HAD superfamily hydrolase (TIGR01509 family)